jgi:hypothetical protein
LISKLETYRMTYKELYQSYCKGRYQWVLIYSKTHHNSTLSNWALGPLLYLLYINDLPQFVSNKFTPILFADGTSMHFTHSNTTELSSNTSTFFETINIWLKTVISNEILKKTNCIHFKTGNNPAIDMNIGYNKLISSVPSTRFLGLTIDSMLPWRIHVDQLTTKLSTACYVIRSIKLLYVT